MRQVHTIPTGGARTALLLVLLCGVAAAAPEKWFLGEPWEQPILRGVAAQRQAMKRGTTPSTLVGRAERNARRDKSAVKLYLLARAYGLRANWHRERARKPRKPGEAERSWKLARDDHASAVATYGEVLRLAPRCYFAYHDMGVMELQRRNPVRRAAFDHLSQAYRRNRNYTPTQRQLINLYLEGKQFGVAIPLLQRLVQLEPGDAEARRRLAVCYAEMQQYDAAYAEVDALLKREPANPSYRVLRAQLDVKTARYDRAIDTFKRLARVNPNIGVPYLGMLEALNGKQERKLPVDAADVVFALKGVRRLERDPKRRAELEREIRRAEHRMTAPDGVAPGSPPTTEQLLHALEAPDEKTRVNALRILMMRKEKPTRAVLQAIARHLDAKTEPAPSVRAGAVAALGRWTGSALIPLLRLALEDPDDGVRAITADTLSNIASIDSAVAGPVIAILGTAVDDPSLEVSADARHAILRLSGTVLPGLDEQSDDAAHRKAFLEWWSGPGGETAQIEALDQYGRIRDKAADQVLVPYLSSPSFFVFRAAYRALQEAGTTAAGEAWKRWYGEMPRFPEDRLVKQNGPSLRQAVSAWVARKPGA